MEYRNQIHRNEGNAKSAGTRSAYFLLKLTNYRVHTTLKIFTRSWAHF